MEQSRARHCYQDGDGRRAAILKSFRCGARRPWCRNVWQAAIEACGGTQDAAAQRLFVTTSAVSEGLQHGRLSIESLTMMMVELGGDGWRPPPLPPREELMQEGYIEAMAYVREPNKSASKRPRISREVLALLSAAISDDQWCKALAQRNHALGSGEAARLRRVEAKLTSLLDRIVESASQRLGRPIDCSLEQLCQLHHAWSAAWTECYNAVPFAWTKET